MIFLSVLLNPMASAFSHAAVAVAVGNVSALRPMPQRFWWLSIVCSILPDADVLGFAVGIEYADMWGHRGVTHSLTFAMFVSVTVTHVWFHDVRVGSSMWWRLIAHFFVVTASHGMLDALTDGGLGVAFFAPFDNHRYFFPWRPVMVSPIGIAPFFSRYGLEVLMSELVWLLMPAVGIILMLVAWRRRHTDRSVG